MDTTAANPPLELAPEASFEEVKRFLEAESARADAQRRERLTSPEMFMLAAVPNWTATLADTLATITPLPQMPAADRLGVLASEGWLKRFQSPLPEERTPELVRFAMPNPLRHEVFGAIAADPQRCKAAWLTVSQLGGAIVRTTQAVKIPDDTALWAELAQHATDSWRLAAEFDALVRSHRDASGIHRLMEAVTRILPLFASEADSTLEMALERAGRRLEVLRRKEDDRTHLASFLERQEQLAAVETLVSSDDDHWALHLVGPGGVGKTMLLRHITTDFSEDRFAVSRIDFDYLNPDYPRLAPGLLLWSFGQDLRVYAPDTSMIDLLDEADRILDKLHQELKANAATGERSPLDHRHFRTALQGYVEFINHLGLRVLLVLDTCEELARVRPDGTVPDNVRDTFRILELLHEGARGSRVLFSGRRLLAREGDGWRAPAVGDLPARPYLSLHEMRGFTQREAIKYLEHAKVPAELHAAIVQRCPEAGRVVAVSWDTLAPATDEPRLNPYDLKLYAEWAAEKPHPSAARIASSTDSNYVEYRIVQRLRSPLLVQLLPVIAMLGHIDNRVLAELADMEPADPAFESLERALRQQEWTSTRGVIGAGGEETRRVHSVDPALRPRLLEHARPRRAEWMPLLDRALAAMTRNTIGGDLGDLDWTDFDATLAAFDEAGRPEQAAQWWEKVEHRLARRNDPEWTRDLLGFLAVTESTSQLAGDGEIRGEPVAARKPAEAGRRSARSAIRPAVLATYATALRRSGAGDVTVTDHWRQVASTAHDFPTPAGRARLRLIAAAGLLMASESPSTDDFEFFERALRAIDDSDFDPETASAAVAAAEWSIDWLESSAREVGTKVPLEGARAPALVHSVDARIAALADAQWRDLAHPPGADPQALIAWASCLGDRAWMWSPGSAQHLDFARTLQLARALDDDLPAWPHWEPPDSLRTRIALDYARHVVDRGVAPATVLETLESIVPGLLAATGSPRELDHALLRGIALGLALADAPATPAVLESLHEGLSCRPGLGTCVTQRAVMPLCCVAAQGLAGQGLVDVAVGRLRNLLRDSILFDEETRRQLERSYLRIVARFRLFEVGEGRVESLLSSEEVQDVRLLRGVDALAGVTLPLRPAKSEPDLEHAYWQTCTVAPPIAQREALEAWHRYLVAQTYAPVIVDSLECRTLLGKAVSAQEVEAGFEATALLTSREEAFRSALRLSALTRHPISDAMKARLDSLAASIGRRKAAVIALDEADLMALRMPARGAHLAMLAYDWFDSMNDDVGRLRAGVLGLLSAGPEASPPESLSTLLRIRASSKARFAQRCWRPLAARTELVLHTFESTADREVEVPASPPAEVPDVLYARRQPATRPARWQAEVIGQSSTAPAEPVLPAATADAPEPILTAPWALASTDLRPWREKPSAAAAPMPGVASEIPSAAPRAPARVAPLLVASAALLASAVWAILRFQAPAAIPVPKAVPANPPPYADGPLGASYAAPDSASGILWALAALGLLCIWAWRQWWLPRSVRHVAKFLCGLGLLVFSIGIAMEPLSKELGGPVLWPGVFALAVAMALRDALIRHGEFLRLPGLNRWLPWVYFAIPSIAFGAVTATGSLVPCSLFFGFLVWRLGVFGATFRQTRKPVRWTALRSEAAVPAPHALEAGATLAIKFEGHETLFPKTRYQQRAFGRLKFRSMTSWSWQDSYERFAQDLLPGALPLLRRLPRLLKLHRLDIDIDAAPLSLHAWPWEALPVLGAVDRPVDPRQVPVRCLRRVRLRARSASRTTVPEFPRGTARVAVFGSARGRLGWIAEQWATRFPGVQERSDTLDGDAPDEPPHGRSDDVAIAHLVGIPHEDSGGLRLRLCSSEADRSNAGDVMIRMSDLAARMPGLRLCILQVLPVAESTDRRPNDRRRAGLLRILAAQLVEACGASVVVIPALPGELASQVLESIVAHVPVERRNHARAARALLEVITHQVAAAIGRSASVRESDIADPLAIAQRLAEPAMSGLRGLLSTSAQARLAGGAQLPRETLAGLLATEFNRLLTVPRLWTTPGLRAAALRALPGFRFGESPYRANRRLLHALFEPALGDGRARVREEAMEVALEITGFVVDDSPRDRSVEPMQSVTA